MFNTSQVFCPLSLLNKASALSAVATAVVNAQSPLVLNSARLATQQGLITPTLIGHAEGIRNICRQMCWDITGIRLVNAGGEIDAATRAVALARGGEVAALMKGDLHTDHLLRAVLDRHQGLRTHRRLSHVFHMSVANSDKSLCITDAAINVLPGVDEKLDIARNVIELCHALGKTTPHVALLSATEQINASVPSSVDAAAIMQQIADGAVTGAVVDGPLAFDNAVSAQAAAIKGINSPIAGSADVLLVPNLEAGNFLFKQMVYFMGAVAAGLVMGATVPIMLTSRADCEQSRLASAALTCIYAAHRTGQG